MTLFEEGAFAMRGCWRLLWRDPAAFEDFNFTIEGFWRSFAMVVPVLVLAYPFFILDHRYAIEMVPAGENPPELQLGVSYFFLLTNVALWPLVAAILARLLGVAHNYVRYMIIYNWMSVPIMVLGLIPYLVHLMTEAGLLFQGLVIASFFFPLFVSWYVAKAALETTMLIAFAFLLADTALTRGLGALIQ